MFTRLHSQFGTAGMVVAVIALIAALSGAAFAAKGGLTGKQKKEVEKIAKKYAGKDGAPGAPGAKGDTGSAGSNGSNGANGTSATTASFSGNEKGCSAGGVEVKSASAPTVICNGKNGTNGTNGAPGQPWTPDNELPAGATLTGAWAFGSVRGEGEGAKLSRVPISFSIPLAAPLAGTNVHFINQGGLEVKGSEGTEEVESTACTGSASNPTASAGHLCVYTGVLFFAKLSNVWIQDLVSELGSSGASTAGAVLAFFDTEEGAAGYGSWAVTAEN